MKITSSQLAKHWTTADEYERMGEAGVAEDARLELIAGEIYKLSSLGSPHAARVNVHSRLLKCQLGETMIVSTQDPIRLNDFSES